jgi:hypothetical protein
MRRALVLLVVAGGFAALFATASQKPSTKTTVTETGRLVLLSSPDDGCTFPQREMAFGGGPVAAPFTFYCHTHGEAERLQKSLAKKDADLAAVSVRGKRLVFSLDLS